MIETIISRIKSETEFSEVSEEAYGRRYYPVLERELDFMLTDMWLRVVLGAVGGFIGGLCLGLSFLVKP